MPFQLSLVPASPPRLRGRSCAEEEVERLQGMLTTLRESAEALDVEDAVTNIDTIFEALIEREEASDSEATPTSSEE